MKKHIIIFLSIITALGLTGCRRHIGLDVLKGSDSPFAAIFDKDEDDDSESATDEYSEETETEDASESSDEISGNSGSVFDNYTDNLTKLAGSSFNMSVEYGTNNGFHPIIDSKSGNLFCEISPSNDENLITADYDSSENILTISSLAAGAYDVEAIDSVELKDFINFDDLQNILISNIDLASGQPAIMIESRSMACTYGDGVGYNITLIKVGENGKLSVLYEDGVSGSADEDITSEVRADFNRLTGNEYSKEMFNDIFYNGNLFIEQKKMPVLASISFKSDSAKYQENGEWEISNEISSKLYNNTNETLKTMFWGSGQFDTVADSSDISDSGELSITDVRWNNSFREEPTGEDTEFTFELSDGSTQTISAHYDPKIKGMEYADIDNDGSDEIILNAYFANTAGEFEYIYAFKLIGDKVVQLYPTKDIPELAAETSWENLTAGDLSNTSIIKTEKDGNTVNALEVSLLAKDGPEVYETYHAVLLYDRDHWEEYKR